MVTATDLEFAEVNVAPALVIEYPTHSSMDPAAIGAASRSAFAALMSFIGRHGLTPNGAPRTIYTEHGAGGVSFNVVMPVVKGPAVAFDEPPIRVDTLAGTRAYRFTHHGPYQGLAQTYNHITEFMTEKGWMKSPADWAKYMPMWEEYLNDPTCTPPTELKTYIYLPAL
jgi:effector-binding domain-containing protein